MSFFGSPQKRLRGIYKFFQRRRYHTKAHTLWGRFSIHNTLSFKRFFVPKSGFASNRRSVSPHLQRPPSSHQKVAGAHFFALRIKELQIEKRPRNRRSVKTARAVRKATTGGVLPAGAVAVAMRLHPPSPETPAGPMEGGGASCVGTACTSQASPR
jgi:hypothetical protein